MSDRQKTPISETELEVLKLLWEHGPRTVREVVELASELGRDWTRSTVITLLQRLERKGYVTSDQSSYVFVFHANVSREELAQLKLEEIAHELYDGEGVPVVLAFAQRHRFTRDELDKLRALIDKWGSKRKGPGSGT